LIFLISSAVLPEAISDAQSLRATASQSMKWLTEVFSARAMIVSRIDQRRKLSAASVYVFDESGDLIDVLTMHKH
jgi:hypothetical protein